ncbi:MAG: hypothetical protein MUC50_02135 [Myxococcota bacterium]|nr:hypothetical protein [Myxococcota bacterium]
MDHGLALITVVHENCADATAGS